MLLYEADLVLYIQGRLYSARVSQDNNFIRILTRTGDAPALADETAVEMANYGWIPLRLPETVDQLQNITLNFIKGF